MIVSNVERVTIHFKNGKYIDFDADEIGLQVVKTEQWNAEGTKFKNVEYYMITTGEVEVGNGGQGP